MKNTTLSLLYGALLSLSLVGCALDYIPSEDDLKNKYMVEWIKNYGLIDPDQDWNMATTVTATIRPETFGEGYTVRVYSAPLDRGGVYIGEADTAMEVEMNMLKTDTELYVRAYNPEGTHYVEATCPIVEGRVDVAALSRAAGDLVEDDGSPRSRAQVVESETEYQWIIACEDLGSTSGTDQDFNDVVIGINYTFQNSLFRLSVTPLAAGGIYRATVYLGNELQDGKPIDANKLFEIHEGLTGYLPDNIATGSYQMYNTTYFDRPGKTYVIEKNETFFDISKNMGNINIWVDFPSGSKLQGAKITAPPIGESPQMICVVGGWQWPKERRSLTAAYPRFEEWNRNATLAQWTEKADPALVVPRSTASTPDPEPEPEPEQTINVYKADGDHIYHLSIPVTSFTYYAGANTTNETSTTERPYEVYVPQGLPETSVPVVIALHGASNRMVDHMPMTLADADAIKEFIVVYPQGGKQNFYLHGGNMNGWNADGTTNADVQYLKDIITALDNDEAFNIDKNRIYVYGFSNGGMMIYSLANCASTTFAAFASIAGYQMNEFRQSYYGYLPDTSGAPTVQTTVPFMHIHGKGDDVVPYGHIGIVRDNMVARMGCNPNGVVDNTINNSSSKKTVYRAGVGNVPFILYEIDGMGHWYGNQINGRSPGQVVWQFFKNDYADDDPQHRATDALKADWNQSIRWAFNPDASYNNEPLYEGMYGLNFSKHGWTIGNEGKNLYWGSKATTEETSINSQCQIYRSIELNCGYSYHMIIEKPATETGDIYLMLQNQKTSTDRPLKCKIPASMSGEIKIGFFVGGDKNNYSEFQFSLCKQQGAPTLGKLEIHKGWSANTEGVVIHTNEEPITFPGVD